MFLLSDCLFLTLGPPARPSFLPFSLIYFETGAPVSKADLNVAMDNSVMMSLPPSALFSSFTAILTVTSPQPLFKVLLSLISVSLN